MASGIACGRVRTTATTTESRNMAAILQITGWQRDMQPWFIVYFFGIGHPCYDQLTPVKTLLTSITWPESDWKIIVWNDKEIRIDNKPVYYKNNFKSGIIYIHDRLFNLNTIDSYHYFSNKIGKSNFLQWAGLRHSVPSHLKEISPNLPKNQKIITRCWFQKKLNSQILSTNWRVILISQPNN